MKPLRYIAWAALVAILTLLIIPTFLFRLILAHKLRKAREARQSARQAYEAARARRDTRSIHAALERLQKATTAELAVGR